MLKTCKTIVKREKKNNRKSKHIRQLITKYAKNDTGIMGWQKYDIAFFHGPASPKKKNTPLDINS